ncbi:MAG: peptide chain release factor 1, partial [Patescibacteria group bacterium]|nr:peptide chain release factor 1 [Patescibacteria group bacterium]
MEIDIQKFKENPKTTYFAVELERLLTEEAEVRELAQGELGALADDDLLRIEEQKQALLTEIKKILDSEKAEEEFPNEAVLEIRAGVGGEEAALFAEELATMYRAYSEGQGWQVRVLAESKTDLGGYKEVSIELRGIGVYKKLRYETGVHRIQRIPATEKSGRIHTST